MKLDFLWISQFVGTQFKVWLTFVNVDLQDFPLPCHLSALTIFTPVPRVDGFALALAVVTHGLYLLYHPRA